MTDQHKPTNHEYLTSELHDQSVSSNILLALSPETMRTVAEAMPRGKDSEQRGSFFTECLDLSVFAAALRRRAVGAASHVLTLAHILQMQSN